MRTAQSERPMKLALFAFAFMLLVTGCLGESESQSPTELVLTAPKSNSTLSVGQSVMISGIAKAPAIARVDIIVNGVIYAVLLAPDKSRGVSVIAIEVPWTPLSPGQHAIQAKAYAPPGEDSNLIAQSSPLILSAYTDTAESLFLPPSPTPVPTLVPTRTPLTTPPLTQPSRAPTMAMPTPPPTPPSSQSQSSDIDRIPNVTVINEFVNVRAGPGVIYPKLGELKEGQTVPVRGKSADGDWWQIAFSSASDGVGWVIGIYVRPNNAAANVPVVAAPPRPVPPQPLSSGSPTEIALIPLIPSAQPTPVPSGAGIPAVTECNELNPDWQGHSNPEWTFCRRRDLEYVGDNPGPVAFVSPDRVLTFGWDVYGVRSVFIVFESNEQHGPRGEPYPGRSFPVTGDGRFSFKGSEIGQGCFRVTLRLVTNRHPDRRIDFGDKRLCIGVTQILPPPTSVSAPSLTPEPPTATPTPWWTPEPPTVTPIPWWTPEPPTVTPIPWGTPG